MIWTTYLDFVFEDDGGTSERMGTWRPAFICTPFALAGSHAQPSEVNLSGCFHLDNSRRRSTCEMHEYMCIAGSLGPLLLSPALRTVSKHVPQPDGPHETVQGRKMDRVNRSTSCTCRQVRHVTPSVINPPSSRCAVANVCPVPLRCTWDWSQRLRRSLC